MSLYDITVVSMFFLFFCFLHIEELSAATSSYTNLDVCVRLQPQETANQDSGGADDARWDKVAGIGVNVWQHRHAKPFQLDGDGW